MKTVRVLHAFEPAIAGVPAWVSEVARQQSLTGHTVGVLAPGALEAGYRARMRECHMFRWNAPRAGLRKLHAAQREVAETIDGFRPDVLHLHSTYAGVVARTLRRRCTTVYQPHAWGFSVSGRLGSALAMAEIGLAGRTDHMIFVSEAERDEGRARGIDVPSTISYVPVDLDVWRAPTDHERRTCRRLLGIDPADLVVVAVGRLCRQKGQDRLVEAWRRAGLSRSRLFLVGPGRPDSLVVDESSRVHHVGESRHVRRWLWAADVAVFASRWEGMSIATAEALACGVPVLATPAGGMEEMVGTGPMAAGVVLDDPGQLTACLSDLDSEFTGDLRATWSARARHRAEQMFDIEAVTRRVATAYRDAGIEGLP